MILTAPAWAKSDLATPEQRRESVNLATALAQPQAPAPLPASLRNPLGPPPPDKQEIAARQSVHHTGDHDVLAAIAPHIIPSGVMQIGDQPVLLLREKKLKVGDYLTITFEGTDYMVELAAINHSSFTLRLNKEEITQPINH
ncbi:MAG TPA: hypothetical protein VK717_11770 [Opitutaceae bacterium]|nr:hypothetical protein [Opitutaceae bacterium]